MKILFDHRMMFFLAHGGFQIQIEQTKRALEGLGVEVEWLRWWDGAQRGDIIHYFGRPNPATIEFAQAKNIRYVLTELLTGQGSWSPLRKWVNRAVLLADGPTRGRLLRGLGWSAFRHADAVLVLTAAEKHLLATLYGAPPGQIHVVPNGVEETFFLSSEERTRREGDYLVCTATITDRKRVAELAVAAVHAEVPVWFIGAPYSEADPYFQRFMELHLAHPRIVRYEGPVNDRARLADIYKAARGFVLLSARESQSLSALEAAAAGCPLLLSDLPWARCTFEGHASYCALSLSVPKAAAILRRFYQEAPSLPSPPRPKTWPEVAAQIKRVYEGLLVRDER